jgi:hypothetical protein
MSTKTLRIIWLIFLFLLMVALLAALSYQMVHAAGHDRPATAWYRLDRNGDGIVDLPWCQDATRIRPAHCYVGWWESYRGK